MSAAKPPASQKQGAVYENVAIFNFIKKLFNEILFQGIRVRPISVDK